MAVQINTELTLFHTEHIQKHNSCNQSFYRLTLVEDKVKFFVFVIQLCFSNFLIVQTAMDPCRSVRLGLQMDLPVPNWEYLNLLYLNSEKREFYQIQKTVSEGPIQKWIDLTIRCFLCLGTKELIGKIPYRPPYFYV